jgi:hypothetical protein
LSVKESELKLDGNSIAGLLREIFTVEMTTASGTCASCRKVGLLGRADVYSNAPGVVVRCPACGQILMRIVRDAGRFWLDLTGTRCPEFADPNSG